MPWPVSVRDAAARFFDLAGENAKRAGEMLSSFLKGEAPARAGEFCRRCYLRDKYFGSVEDRPRTGRPRKVPDELAKRIAAKLVGDKDSAGNTILHSSLRSCLDGDEEQKAQVHELGIHRTTLSRSLRRVEPNLVRRKVRIRRQLNEQQKKQRWQAAKKLKRLSKYELRATVFLDEATLELSADGGRTVYWHRGVDLPIATSKHIKRKAAFRVHYISGVLHGVGSVGIYKLTGTTGHPKKYKVR